MTGQDFQDKLDKIVVGLQTDGKGQQVQILTRASDNSSNVFQVSSDVNGVVDTTQLAPVQAFINPLKTIADTYETERVGVINALDAFKTAESAHQSLIDAAKVSRDNLSAALDADATYQSAKTALDAARADPDYVAALASYRNNSVSENYGNLGEANGKYSSI